MARDSRHFMTTIGCVAAILSLLNWSCGQLSKSDDKAKQASNVGLGCSIETDRESTEAGGTVKATVNMTGEPTRLVFNGLTMQAPGLTYVAPVRLAHDSVLGATVFKGTTSATCTKSLTVTGAIADAPGCILSVEPSVFAVGETISISMTTTGKGLSAKMANQPATLPSFTTTTAVSMQEAITGEILDSSGASAFCTMVLSPQIKGSDKATGGSCEATSQELTQAAGDAAATTSTNRTAALTAAQLTTVEVAGKFVEGNRFSAQPFMYCQVVPALSNAQTCPTMLPAPESDGSLKPGEMYTFSTDGQTFNLLAGPAETGGCNQAKPYQFAKKSDGSLYTLNDSPKTIDLGRHTLCGCAPTTCGGAAWAPSQYVYLIEQPTSFRGAFALTYDAPTVMLSYDNLQHASSDQSGEYCEDPP